MAAWRAVTFVYCTTYNQLLKGFCTQECECVCVCVCVFGIKPALVFFFSLWVSVIVFIGLQKYWKLERYKPKGLFGERKLKCHLTCLLILILKGGRLVQKQMVQLARIIKRRMWNIRGTAEGKAVRRSVSKWGVLNVCHDLERVVLCRTVHSAVCPIQASNKYLALECVFCCVGCVLSTCR